MPFTVRPVTTADLDLLTQLRVDFLAEVNQTSDPAVLADLHARNRAYFAEKVHSGEFRAWFAEIEGQVVGTSGFVLFNRPPTVSNPSGWDGYIMNIYTLPVWRGQGIARTLFETVIEHARTTPAQRLWLHATENGRPLYAKFGFKPSGDEMELALG